jgi:Predicted membrane protein
LLEQLKGLPPELGVFLVASLPIFELRGAIPLGIFYYDLPPWKTLILAILGNILPLPFLLLFLRPISVITSRWGITRAFFDFLYKSARKKGVSVLRLKLIGLYLFVALPVPGTGAWMGALVAEVFNLGFFPALISISLGVITAGLVITFVSKFGIFAILAFFVLLFIISYFLSRE